jgi:hypothetical protein
VDAALVKVKQKTKLTGGGLLQQGLTSPRLAEFEEDFFMVLKRVQVEMNAIEDLLEVRDAFEIMLGL